MLRVLSTGRAALIPLVTAGATAAKQCAGARSRAALVTTRAAYLAKPLQNCAATAVRLYLRPGNGQAGLWAVSRL